MTTTLAILLVMAFAISASLLLILIKQLREQSKAATNGLRFKGTTAGVKAGKGSGSPYEEAA